MTKRRKHRRWEGEDEELDGRERRRRRLRLQRAGRETGVAVATPARLAPPRPITCHQCAHLVITRSFVKHVSQSWDRAVIFPTYTCFQQGWTLEDPAHVADHAGVCEYLVARADECPHFQRGQPRDHEW